MQECMHAFYIFVFTLWSLFNMVNNIFHIINYNITKASIENIISKENNTF